MQKKKKSLLRTDLRGPLVACAVIGLALLGLLCGLVYLGEYRVVPEAHVPYYALAMVGLYAVVAGSILAAYLARYRRIQRANEQADRMATEISDMFRYVVDIPSQELEKLLKLESERFRDPVMRLFHTELEAVYEEFNQGQDNENGLVFEALSRRLFPSHPYGWTPFIGNAEHLKNPSITEIRKFYRSYYTPENIALLLCGDLDFDRTIQLVDRYFGTLQGGAAPVRDLPREKPMTANVTEDVKLLEVDGVEPTIENIKSGEYAISRPLNVVYKTADIEGSPLYSDYLSFLSSSQAQQIISEEGYVSIVDGAQTYAAPETPLSGTIQISGSTSLQPLMILLAEAYEQLNGNVSIEVAGGGSGTGYENAENGVSAFGMISEEFASEKAPSCVYSTVAKDGIGIIVNLDNPVEDISLEDLSRLYDVDASPAISSWSELITE